MLYHFHVTKNAKQIIEEEGGRVQNTPGTMWVIGESLQECIEYAQASERMRQATIAFAGQIPDTCKDTFLFHRKNKYKGVLPKKSGGGIAEVAADGIESTCNMPIEDISEGTAAIMCFSLWQDMIIAQTTPSERRFEEDFLAFYGKEMENSALFYVFCGFLGGMDFARITSKLQEKKGQKVTL